MSESALPKTALGHLSINLQQDQWQGSDLIYKLLGLTVTTSGPRPLKDLLDLVHARDQLPLRSQLAVANAAGYISYELQIRPLHADTYLSAELTGFVRQQNAQSTGEFIGSLQIQSVHEISNDQTLLNYTDDMLALLDQNLRYTAMNNAYAFIFGKTSDAFIGSTIASAFAHDPEHYQNVIHPILEECQKGKTVRYERWIPIPRLGELFLDISYTPIFDGNQAIQGIAIVGRNRTEVMRSIEALQRNESLLNRTEHIANLGGWFFNVESDEIQWTNEMYAIHEVDRDFELNQDSINSFIPDEYLEEILHKLGKTLNEGVPSEVSSPIITANGVQKWVRSLSFPVIENGKVVCIEGILQDITELTNIQQKLQQSEETYRTLVEETNALVWEAEIDPYRFSYMSPQAETLTGYSASQWCSAGFLPSKIHPDDREQSFNCIKRHIAVCQDFIVEYRFKIANGTYIWLHDDIKVIVDKHNKPTKMRGVMIDITQLKEMQIGLNRALRSLENHKYILDQHAIVSSTDRLGNITYVNEKFIEISGYEREELIGKNHRMFKSGLHPAGFFQKLWNTITSGLVWQGEICNRKKNGSLNWVHTTIVPLSDEQGNIEEFISVRTDITELKRTEDSLRRAQKMEAIGQLTGGIAHDFNNLLSIVIGNLELIELVLPGKQNVRAQLESAKNAAMRGSVLTRRLLNFSHQTPILGKSLDLNTVMKGLEVLVSKSLTALVQVEMNLSPDLWQVEVDPGDFEDVIINLSINASDAMPQGGKLRFFTRNYEVAHMEFKINGMIPPGQYVEILIVDSGVGMTQEVLEKIFEPYFSTKPSDKGSGLGLAMVYGFVKRSKGLIFVESKPGNGTTFTILLPKSAHESSTVTESTELKPQKKLTARNNETILLVDDEADILKITRTNLENLGYRVLTANNGDEALEVVQGSENIDLLFTDIVMPGKLNGYELAEAAIVVRPALKLLFTTGYAKVENKITREDWINALIQKPYRSSELSKKIRETLDKQH